MWSVIGTLLAIGAVGVLAVAGGVALVVGVLKLVRKTLRYVTRNDDEMDIKVNFRPSKNDRYY